VSELLYLSRADLASLGVTMTEVVDAVDAACRAKGEGKAVMPPKLTLHGEGGAFSQVMAASLPGEGALGAKWVTLFPGNRALGLPVTNGLVVLGDPRTGLPVAVMDAATVTAWRTGASVGVAARYLARPRADRVGVLGCGVQARAAVSALAAVLPGLRHVACHDAVPQAADAFARELGAAFPHVRLSVRARPEEVAAGAAVVLSAITMTEDDHPPLHAGLLEPGGLAVALDYDAAWAPEAMAECDRFFCDDTAGVLATRAAGARLAGIPGEIAGDLGELAAGRVRGRRDDAERLFCLNLGMAAEDVVTARLALDRARALGVGRLLPL
jgi:ornithine cyclodeaminase/alanine dehydrogenase